MQQITGKYRYTVLGLVFLAVTINYIDRQIIGLLKPILEKEFQWTEKDYADIVFWFQVMYAIGYLLAGRFIDKAGSKIGYGLAVFLWSLAELVHAFACSTAGFKIARGALGFTEGGNLPAAVKTIAEWFPVKERSFATGFMISGTTVAPIIAPAIVLWLANAYNWQTSFIVTATFGFLWLIAWYLLYDKPERSRRINKQELAYINEGKTVTFEDNKVAVKTLLQKKATWGFFIATFLTDPVWWFYLFWLPSYLTSNGMSKTEITFPLTVVYAITALLSITGGWLSSYFLKLGWSINRSRKITMLIAVGMALPVTVIGLSKDVWVSVFIIAIAASAQTIWKGILLTSIADQFPRKAVSSVSGISGLGGGLGGMLAAEGVGILLNDYKTGGNIQGGYNLIFVLCGLAYILAILAFHILSSQLKKVTV